MRRRLDAGSRDSASFELRLSDGTTPVRGVKDDAEPSFEAHPFAREEESHARFLVARSGGEAGEYERTARGVDVASSRDVERSKRTLRPSRSERRMTTVLNRSLGSVLVLAMACGGDGTPPGDAGVGDSDGGTEPALPDAAGVGCDDLGEHWEIRTAYPLNPGQTIVGRVCEFGDVYLLTGEGARTATIRFDHNVGDIDFVAWSAPSAGTPAMEIGRSEAWLDDSEQLEFTAEQIAAGVYTQVYGAPDSMGMGPYTITAD
jgi:hypothetical protein